MPEIAYILCRKEMLQEVKAKPDCFSPIFAESLFCGLTPRSLESLTRIKQIKEFRKGARFFSAGDLPHCVYLLVRGKAELRLDDKSRDLHFARFIERNEILGLTEMIVDLPYETDVRAKSLCLCEYFSREDFIDFLVNEPKICYRLLKLLGLKLHKSYQLLIASTN